MNELALFAGAGGGILGGKLLGWRTICAVERDAYGAQFWQPEGTTLTVCAMQLTNGTIVIGESACVSESNFDADIGKNIAYDSARQKVWALEGYLLKQNLMNTPPVE